MAYELLGVIREEAVQKSYVCWTGGGRDRHCRKTYPGRGDLQVLLLVLKTHRRNLGTQNGLLRCSLVILLLALLLISCSEAPSENSETVAEQRFVEISGRRVPVFLSAEEQLNYSRSWFAETDDKKAALRALVQLYPEKRQYSALAELDLAYLELGGDYRFAPEHAAFTALKAYKEVLRNYAEFPYVQAKAYWYIAWIYSDLLQDIHKGLEYFQRVAHDFPNEQVVLLPSAPWVSIIYPDEEDIGKTLYSPPANYWAALALVEIIRYTENDETAWQSFLSLWRNYRETVSVGFGLRLILARRCHVDEALLLAREFLENDFSNVHLLGDIQQLINAMHPGEGEG